MKNHVLTELKSAGMSAADAEHAFDEVAKAMRNVVARGDRVRLPGLGILARKHRKESVKRNPRTGETMTIGGYDVVSVRNSERF